MCHLKEPVPDSFVPPTPFKHSNEDVCISFNTPATDSLAIFSSVLSKKRKFSCASSTPPKKIRSPSDHYVLKEQSLIDAARSGNLNALQNFLDDPSYDVNESDPLGNTALHFGVFNNQVPVVLKLLSSEKTKIDSTNRLGLTPLLSAVECGHSALVRILVSKGASVSVADNQGFTVLHKAVLTGNTEILRYLLKREFIPLDSPSNEQQLTPLHQAAFHGNKTAVKLLITAGCNVSPLSSHRTTPLHMAALKNHSKVVEYLLRSGSSPDEIDNHKRTPLHYACLYGHLDTATVLCKHGCSASIEDFKYQTPLQLAARSGFQYLLPLLLPSAD